ncbi:sialin [Tribolium castaneum]|uniref:sialin n=1 Tax=Tribolium castaneum TaxID=7070 RepID=UPI00077DED92|nr:PREDICTED: sialin-like isoform X2 [Tribolium castaneum]|eukprot:XP_008196989.2 PREDICTED: sialin-like isoform X2 [Tribolium castaneum]
MSAFLLKLSVLSVFQITKKFGVFSFFFYPQSKNDKSFIVKFKIFEAMSGSDQLSHFSSLTSRFSQYSENEYSKYFVIPQRYIFCLLASLIMMNTTSIHSTIEVIALQNFIFEKSTNTVDTCQRPETTKKVERQPKNISLLIYDWSLSERYLISDTYYWSSLLSLIPGGIISAQFGGKYVITLSVLFSGFCTLMAPALIDLSNGKLGFVLTIRALNGFFQGLFIPSAMSLLAHWAPNCERAVMTSIIYGTAVLGNQICRVMHTAFMNLTWRPMFYLFACIHLTLCVFWHLLVYPSPGQNPFLSVNEKRCLNEDPDDSIVMGRKPIPWRRIYKSCPVWTLGVYQLGSSWAWQVYKKTLSWYLPLVLKTGVMQSAWWTPFFLYFGLTITFGFVADWFVKGGHVGRNAMRKIYIVIGNYGTALCFMFVTFEGCNRETVMVYTTIFLCLDATYFASTAVIPLDLTSNFAGIILGIMWSIEHFLISTASYIVDLFTKDESLTQWMGLFWTTCGIQIFASTIFLLYGDANRQAWNYIGPQIN